MSSTFYLNADDGDDAANGLNQETAWKSLDRVSQHIFHPGDCLLLKRGNRWSGELHPKGAGEANSPIILGAYGEGELPIVDGMGSVAAVRLSGQSHWIIRELHAQNRSDGRGVRHGIFVQGDAHRITEGVVVERCEISLVSGENRRALPKYQSMYWNGGIYVCQPNRSTLTAHLENIIIRDNYIHDVMTSGIRIAQQEDYVIDAYHRDVVVCRNHIERTGSDGIIVANCIAPFIEDNRCFEAGFFGTLEETKLIAGIWVCSVRDALIRRNEVARTHLFENDGTAFDTDWGVSGTITFEDNYSHGNEGGFFLDCGGLNPDVGYVKTILRGNVSINDKRCLVQDMHSHRVEFEGNYFFQDEDRVEIHRNSTGANHHFRNNAFFFSVPPRDNWCTVDLGANTVKYSWTKRPPLLDGYEQFNTWKSWMDEVMAKNTRKSRSRES